MLGNPANQVFRSYAWTVVKEITNAFEDAVSNLTVCLDCFVFPVYITFLFLTVDKIKQERGKTCKVTADCTDCPISVPLP
jgi:hypothetical protein